MYFCVNVHVAKILMTKELIFIIIETMMLDHDGGKCMAKCPKCGRDVANPRKSWKMAGRPDRTGKRTELTIGLFDCPSCGPFRVVLGKRKI